MRIAELKKSIKKLKISSIVSEEAVARVRTQLDQLRTEKRQAEQKLTARQVDPSRKSKI